MISILFLFSKYINFASTYKIVNNLLSILSIFGFIEKVVNLHYNNLCILEGQRHKILALGYFRQTIPLL
jgi:hypothetical protein